MVDKPFYQNTVSKTSRDMQQCLLGVCGLCKTVQLFCVKNFTSSSIYAIFPDTFLDGFRITLACVGEDLRSFLLCLKFCVLNAFRILLDTFFILDFFLVRLGGLAVGGLACLLFAFIHLGSFGSGLLFLATLFGPLSFFPLMGETSAVFPFGFGSAFGRRIAGIKGRSMIIGSAIGLLE